MSEGDIHYALCVRVEHQPHPVTGSSSRRCEQCTAEVWVSPSTRRVMAEQPNIIVLCMECGLDQAAMHAQEGECQLLPMSSAQAAELLEHGLTLEQIHDLAERGLSDKGEPDDRHTTN